MGSGKEGDRQVFSNAKEFLETFKKGEDFTRDLLKENERLRLKIVSLEQRSESSFIELEDEFKRVKEENQTLKKRFSEVESENRDFASRHIEVEEENNNLANLYVASYQLHSTLDYDEVIRIISEIVINLVGSDQFAILVLDETSNELQLVASEGIDGQPYRRKKVGEDTISEVVKTGESFYVDDSTQTSSGNSSEPVVCIPLKIKEKVIGVLVIFSLFEQKKKKLTQVDFELFSMLAGHAATALFSSKLYSQSERKLSTLQGFLKLLSADDKLGK